MYVVGRDIRLLTTDPTKLFAAMARRGLIRTVGILGPL